MCSVVAAGDVGPRYAATWIVVLMTSTSQRSIPYAAAMAVTWSIVAVAGIPEAIRMAPIFPARSSTSPTRAS